MTRERFEPTIPCFKPRKTFFVLNRAADVIGCRYKGTGAIILHVLLFILWRAAWKPEYCNPKIRLGFAKRVSAETNPCRRFRGNGRESTVPEATGLETDAENLEVWWSLSGPPRAYLRRLSKQSKSRSRFMSQHSVTQESRGTSGRKRKPARSQWRAVQLSLSVQTLVSRIE
jgi:hypothetical protein